MAKTFLHVGCGPKRKDSTTRGFNRPEWTELTLDVDQSVKPDIVGSMTDMSAVSAGTVDALFSSHNIEHLFVHEVPVALKEFRRVLKSDGFVVLTCPDLQGIAELIAADRLTDAAYTSPAGPIRPVDMLFGFSPSIAAGNRYMAHHCGFTKKVLIATLQAAGFASVAAARRPHPFYDLWAVASVQALPEEQLRALAAQHFPSGGRS